MVMANSWIIKQYKKWCRSKTNIRTSQHTSFEPSILRVEHGIQDDLCKLVETQIYICVLY